MNATDPPQVGPVLQKRRKERRLTLDQLSELSGVSRSMLSQIERGRANPTLAVLWNLTRALGIDLSDLTGSGEAETEPVKIALVAEHETPVIHSADGGCRLRILSPPELAGDTEWYELEIAPGATLESAPHAPNAVEHFTAQDGRFQVQSGGSEVLIAAGETARYPADVPHSIGNPFGVKARGLLIVLYR